MTQAGLTICLNKKKKEREMQDFRILAESYFALKPFESIDTTW